MSKIAALVDELSRVLGQKDVIGIITGYLLRSEAEKMRDWIETLKVCSREQHRATVERYRSDCHICCSAGLRYIDDPVLERVYFRLNEDNYEWYTKDIYRHIYANYWHSTGDLASIAKGMSPEQPAGVMSVIRDVLDDW